MTAERSADMRDQARIARGILAARLANVERYLHTHDFDIWHQYQITPDQRVKHAAVLVPLVNRPEGVHVLLTQRTAHLNGHAGQISFPGGQVESGDKHRQDTALRETEEEIGVPRARITVLGELPPYEMNSGFRIAPVIGWIEPPYPVKLDPFEVQDIFEVPLAHFLEPANYQRRGYVMDGVNRRYLAIPYAGRYIWGATAGMLYLFHQLLRG